MDNIEFQKKSNEIANKYIKLYRRAPTMEEIRKELGISTVVEAAYKLLGVCDGAVTRDSQGYNGLDSRFVRDVLGRMEENGRPLSYKQESSIYRTLKNYTVQLSGLGIEYDSIIVPLEPVTRIESFENKPMILDFKAEKYSNFYLYSKREFSQQARAIPTAYWHPETKSWSYQSKPEVAVALTPYISSGVIKPTEAAVQALAKLNTVNSARSTVQTIKDDGLDLAPTLSSSMPVQNVQPYEHQIKAFQVGITLDQAALLMEQGTGKTLSAIAVSGYRFMKGQIKKLLIVSPNSVVSVWENEYKMYADFDYEMANLSGKKNESRDALLHAFIRSRGLQIALINYESVWRVDQLLINWKPDMVIIDESQKIKNGQAKQSRGLWKLGDIARYKLNLTGTPVTQGPLDVWSQYRFLNPDIFGKRFVSFRDRYAIMGGYGGYEITGYKNLPELADKAHSIAYRVTKDEAGLKIPPVEQVIEVEISDEARKIYSAMEDDFLVEIGDKSCAAPIVLTQLLRLQQITGGYLPMEDESGTSVRLLDSSKLNALKDFIRDLPKQKKIVVFARFVPELNGIEKVVQSLGRKFVTLKGGVQNRGDLIDSFQKNPDVTVFIAQIQTGGLGITLTASDTIVFYSTTFSFADYIQAKARIDRIGQKSDSVTYISLVAKNTVDEDIQDILENKGDMATLIVDTMRNRLGKINSKNPFTTSSKEFSISNGANDKINLGGENQMAKTEKTTVESKESKLTGKLANLKADADKKGTKPGATDKPEVKKESGKSTSTKAPAKSAKAESDTNVITLKEILANSDIDPKAARRTLRKSLERNEGERWEWVKDSATYDQVMELLGLVEKPAKSTKKGAKAAKVEEPEAEAKNDDEGQDDDLEEPEEEVKPAKVKKVVVKNKSGK